jgi:RNA polymerase sigma-70 factor (ECF subfamily)
MVDLESSSTLVLRAQEGDPDALERLLTRYLPRLQRWASGRLPASARGMSDTQDLVQEALIGTIRNLKDFRDQGEGALQGYLRQAVLNRMRDEIRRQAARPGGSPVVDAVVDPAPSPLESAMGRETFARYDRALATLDPLEREAVVARLELGCSYQEIAELLEKPSADAARMQVARTLEKLARMMADEHLPPR